MNVIDVARLTPSERADLDATLRERAILSDPLARVSGTLFWVAAALSAALLVASLALGFGVIDSSSKGPVGPVVFALVDGALFALVVRSAQAARAASAATPLPWKTGRFLYPSGLFDTFGRVLRYAAPGDITGIDVLAGERGPSGMSLFAIAVRCGDETITFRLFGTEANVPRDELAAFLRPPAADAASGAGYREGPTHPAWLDREAIARVRKSPEPETKRDGPPRAGRVAWGLGAAAAMLLWLFVLPMLSMASARSSAFVARWRALEAAFPLPWVTGAARAAVDARWRAADAAVDSRIAPEHRDAVRQLLAWKRGRERQTIVVAVSSPPYAEMQAATRWLKANAQGAPASDVIVAYASTYLMDRVPGDEAWLHAVETILREVVDDDLVRLELARGDAAESGAARVVVASHMLPEHLLRGEGPAVFAGVSFDFDVDAVVPGSPGLPLARGLHVPAPESLEMVRMKFAGDKLPAFGSDGDKASFTDGVSVYAQELASASGTASSALVGAVGTRTKRK
jgi:hypothetical protein